MTRGVRSAYVEVIEGCNLRCDYCYVGVERNGHNTRVAAERVHASLQQLREAGCVEVAFLGGEPTLHPDLPALIDDASTLGFTSIGMVTNASTFRPAVVQSLVAALGGWVDVTLRAFDDEVVAQMTGRRASLSRLATTACRYAEAGAPVGFEIDVLPENQADLDARLDDFLDSLDFAPVSIRLHRIAPVGDGASRSDPRLSSSQWNDLLHRLRVVSEGRSVPIFLEDGLPLCLIDPALWSQLVPCECGRDFVTVGPDGGTRDCPCRAPAPHTNGSFVSLRTGPFAHPGAPGPDASMHPECSRCVVEPTCRGGCRASAGFDGSVDQFADELTALIHLTPAHEAALACKPVGVFLQGPMT